MGLKLKIAVGIPTYLEASSIVQAVESVLARDSCAVEVFVSDRSENQESIRAMGDLLQEPAVKGRASKSPDGLSNFYETGRWMLEEGGLCDAYVFLAGDDWWSPELASQCLDAMKSSGADIVAPMFVWSNQGETSEIRPLSLMHSSPFLRQLSMVLHGIEAEPAHLIYGLYSREAFTCLLVELKWMQNDQEYATDVAAAYSMVRQFQVTSCPNARVFRRVAAAVDLPYTRLGIPPLAPGASRLQRLAYSRRVVAVNAWRVGIQLPDPWHRLPVRIMVVSWWNLRSLGSAIRASRSRYRNAPAK